MRIVSLVTPGGNESVAVPVNAGTHGAAFNTGIATTPVSLSQFFCHVVLSALPSFCAAWNCTGMSDFAVSGFESFGSALSLVVLHPAKTKAIVATTMIAMSGVRRADGV